jgi:hypothetical protein
MLQLPKDATAAQVCEAWVRSKEPGLSDKEVDAKAHVFFNSDRQGSLTHLFDAQIALQLAGIMEADWVSALPNEARDGAICFLENESGERSVHFYMGDKWLPF